MLIIRSLFAFPCQWWQSDKDSCQRMVIVKSESMMAKACLPSLFFLQAIDHVCAAWLMHFTGGGNETGL
ncbi:hypothetical protein [uncultured Faecalibaculum sp.]|uniref:hypothetical protein n=1 Tax=uncultured Faecalibaculum sp. TaxID=1729681 RepID=UPI002711FA41|nr:hypothetical protein [uncultured Faecalibaculum sp.]